MSATVLPELAAESVETAERLVRLSVEEGLDSAEADYIVASGLAAIERVPRLWPIIRSRIGRGATGPTTRELLGRLLSLSRVLQEPVRIIRQEMGRDPEAAARLATIEGQLQEIRAEAVRLLNVVDAPGPRR